MKNYYFKTSKNLLLLIGLGFLLNFQTVIAQNADFSYNPEFPCDRAPITFYTDTTIFQPIGTSYYYIIDNQNYFWHHTFSTTLSYGWHNIEFHANDSLNQIFLDTTKTIFVDTFCYNNFIQGQMYYDVNANGSKDPGELGVNNGQIKFTNNQNQFFVFTDDTGAYSFVADTGTYVVEAELNSYYQLTSSPTNYSVTFNSFNNLSIGNDFGINTDSIVNDLSVSISNTAIRPGFSSYIYVRAKNEGTLPASGTVQVFLDPITDFISANPPEDSINSSAVYFSFPPIQPNVRANFRLEVKVDSAVALGTPINMSAFVFPITGDKTPANNFDTLSTQVVGSYDPNDKLVFPFDDSINRVDPGQAITYTIRFQNVGTYFAENVRIVDDIESNLDLSTLQLLSASHEYTSFQVYPSGRIVWRFDGIQLPAEQDDEPGSHGFVKFKINPVSTIPLGTIVNNTAEIYFDFNQPIVTNTINSTIDTAQTVIAIEELMNSKEFNVYPNPFMNTLDIKSNASVEEPGLLEIYALSGKRLKSTKLNKGLQRIDLTDLESGIYIYQIKTDLSLPERGKLIKL